MFDYHTHNLAAPAGTAIINVPREWLLCPDAAAFVAGGLYSVGIHPWWTEHADELDVLKAGVERLLERPDVVAVGECGIDRLRGASLDVQEDVFRWHIALATAASRPRPLIIHCVRAFDILLRLRKQCSILADSPWVIHGFRGRPALARQLLDAGLSLSFGRNYNAESFALTPPDRRFRETDDDYPQF